MIIDTDARVIALDPSGNFSEGKGTTGYAISHGGYIYDVGQIAAAEFANQMEYWTAVLTKIRTLNKTYKGHLTVVCEDYRLYASASEAQINSNLETPQFIGAIKWFCYMNNIPIVMQMAAEVKDRWSDKVLREKGIIKEDPHTRCKMIGKNCLGKHSIDAVRHLIHYNTFKAERTVYVPKKTFRPASRDNY